jgi:hypothetical protein
MRGEAPAGSRYRDRAAQVNAVPTQGLHRVDRTPREHRYGQPRGQHSLLAVEWPQLDVHRLVAPQAVDQRDQDAVQYRMLADEQSSGVRGLLAL